MNAKDLKVIRKAMDISQSQMAEALEISIDQLRALESGENIPVVRQMLITKLLVNHLAESQKKEA